MKTKNIKKMKQVLKSMEETIEQMEAGERIESIVEEIPESVLGVFDEEGQDKFIEVYVENRQAGNDIEKSLDICSRLVTRSYGKDTSALIENIHKNVSELRESK